MNARKVRFITGLALGIVLAVLPFFVNNYWTDVCVSIGLYALLALSLTSSWARPASSTWGMPPSTQWVPTQRPS